jgi:hypothetical protein
MVLTEIGCAIRSSQVCGKSKTLEAWSKNIQLVELSGAISAGAVNELLTHDRPCFTGSSVLNESSLLTQEEAANSFSEPTAPSICAL